MVQGSGQRARRCYSPRCTEVTRAWASPQVQDDWRRIMIAKQELIEVQNSLQPKP